MHSLCSACSQALVVALVLTAFSRHSNNALVLQAKIDRIRALQVPEHPLKTYPNEHPTANTDTDSMCNAGSYFPPNFQHGKGSEAGLLPNPTIVRAHLGDTLYEALLFDQATLGYNCRNRPNLQCRSAVMAYSLWRAASRQSRLRNFHTSGKLEYSSEK